MSETVSEPNPDPASIAGLEFIFESSELGSLGQNPRNSQEEPSSELVAGDVQEIVSTDEAARRLGISTRAVIKRLKNGSLHGYRDSSKSRGEWRIYWKEPSSEPDKSRSSDGTKQKEPTEPGSSKGTKRTEPGGTDSILYVVELNKQLLDQVQALTYRNGYLQAQIAEREQDIVERDEQIKLLTDSRHNKGWWPRFCAWFLGQQQ